MKLAVIGCLCGALAAAGCADGRGGPTSPSATLAVSGADGTVAPLSSASPRSGDLHVTKVCPSSTFTGEPGSYCTITSSNVQVIEVGSRIVYLQPDQLGALGGSDVVLDLPGPGNNKAFGNCSLASGVCTFSGGTGKFIWFQARINVSATDDFSLWFWNGTYSFSRQD